MLACPSIQASVGSGSSGRSGGSSSLGITALASLDRSPGCPWAHSSIRSALILLSQVSAPGAPGLRVSQRSTSAARLVFQPLTPGLSSFEATASSIAAPQASYAARSSGPITEDQASRSVSGGAACDVASAPVYAVKPSVRDTP